MVVVVVVAVVVVVVTLVVVVVVVVVVVDVVVVVVDGVLPGEGVLLLMLDVELPPALVLLEVVDDMELEEVEVNDV